jgi:hypothetical protein
MRKGTKRTGRKTRPRTLTRKVQIKLRAIRQAAAYSFPTADIRQMLDEIERGYQE